MIDPFWWPVIVAGILAGGSSGMMGVYIVGMRIPFLAVCVAHAALAGAVAGTLIGLTGQWILLPALGAAMATALTLGLLQGGEHDMDANIAIGVLFSLSMGLAFMGIGLFPKLGRSSNEVLGLLWGSLNFCQWGDVRWIAAVSAALALFVAAFAKELRAIMFSRLHAAAAGVAVVPIWTALLILTSTALTVNFQTVGGLMIYSLITNPAVAAFQLTTGHHRVLLLATLLGSFCALTGFVLAAMLDLPTGATIVIVSAALVGCSTAIRRLRRRG